MDYNQQTLSDMEAAIKAPAPPVPQPKLVSDGPAAVVSPVEQSPDVGQLMQALAKAQGEMEAAIKSSSNPHFKSKYADLASVIEAAVPCLSKNGIAVNQFVAYDQNHVRVTTRLSFKNEFVQSTLKLPAVQATPHGIGSSITYAKRYGLQSLVVVAAEDDDDGNAGSGSKPMHNDSLSAEARKLEERIYKFGMKTANGVNALVAYTTGGKYKTLEEVSIGGKVAIDAVVAGIEHEQKTVGKSAQVICGDALKAGGLIK